VTLIAQFNPLKLFLPLVVGAGLGALLFAGLAGTSTFFSSIVWLIVAAGWLSSIAIAGLGLLAVAVHRSVPTGISSRSTRNSVQ
jgi:hypothetical protein